MFPNHHQYEVTLTDRRRRYEAGARKQRLLGSLRRHRSAAVDGATSPAALPSMPLGRTPSAIERHAA